MRVLTSLSLAVIVMVGTVHGQMLESVTTKDETIKCNYVIVFRETVNSIQTYNGFASPTRYTKTQSECFESVDGIMQRLNNDFYDRKRVNIDPENLIAIYDLKSAKKISFSYKEVPKVIKKHIEVKEESWTDKFYDIKP